MISITNTEVHGLESAVRGMRNPMNSWDKSDSRYKYDNTTMSPTFRIGGNDLQLMSSLIKAGNDHAKCLRYITVYCDITAPLFWWSEFDTYKVGTVRNSCSKMHKIHSEPITLADFSTDLTFTDSVVDTYFESIVNLCEELRVKYNETNDKKYWRMLIELLPESYNQKSTVMLNYQVLRHMYDRRKDHKLIEWRCFCDWVKNLPYASLITYKEE